MRTGTKSTTKLVATPLWRGLMAHVKRRFLQFSLRGLLGFAALVCLLLGGRHLLETYGSYIEVGKATAGKPVRIKGRLLRIFGPQKCSIEIDAHIVNHDYAVWRWGSWRARLWLCCYEFDFETIPSTTPRELMLDAELYPLDRGDSPPLAIAKSKTFMVEPDTADAANK